MSEGFGWLVFFLWIFVFWGEPDVHDKFMDWIDRQNVVCENTIE